MSFSSGAKRKEKKGEEEEEKNRSFHKQNIEKQRWTNFALREDDHYVTNNLGPNREDIQSSRKTFTISNGNLERLLYQLAAISATVSPQTQYEWLIYIPAAQVSRELTLFTSLSN